MATQTPNYGLIKPDYTDPVDVDVLNDNADLIDAALTAKANLVGGKVPASELPSYVDDVIEGYYYNGAFYSDSGHTTPITGETGKIYIDLDTESCYRWSGSVYVKISSAADALYVEFTESSGVYSCDTGLADMYDALDKGREVIGQYDDGVYYVGNYDEAGEYITFYSYSSTAKISELFGSGILSPTWIYDEYSLTGGGGGQLPTATNLGDIPSWNPGTQLWEITHKGSIAQSNQGWVTGGDVYTAIGNIPQIPVGTNTGDILVWNGYDWVSQQPSELPRAYQKCEYIASSGTQYIDTLYKPNEAIAIEADFMVTASGQNQGLYGGREQGGVKQALCLISPENTKKIRFDYSTGNANVPNNFIYENTILNVRTKFKAESLSDSVKAYVNDIEELSQSETFTQFEGNESIAICCVKTRTQGTGLYGSFRIYGFKIWKSSVLVRNFIPCYNTLSGDIGLYDLVNGSFYTNKGTGTFTKGADV